MIYIDPNMTEFNKALEEWIDLQWLRTIEQEETELLDAMQEYLSERSENV